MIIPKLQSNSGYKEIIITCKLETLQGVKINWICTWSTDGSFAFLAGVTFSTSTFGQTVDTKASVSTKTFFDSFDAKNVDIRFDIFLFVADWNRFSWRFGLIWKIKFKKLNEKHFLRTHSWVWGLYRSSPLYTMNNNRDKLVKRWGYRMWVR